MLSESIAFAHDMLAAHVEKTDRTIDATAGNGKDTLFLARISAHVFAFDIQKEALARTRQLLAEAGADNVTLIHDSHHNIPLYVHDDIKAVVFNLGYLPGGDKHLTTKAPTTIEAVENATEILCAGGIIVIMVYPGHPEGRTEEKALDRYVKTLPADRFHVVKYQPLNRKDAPYPIIIEKRKENPL